MESGAQSEASTGVQMGVVAGGSNCITMLLPPGSTITVIPSESLNLNIAEGTEIEEDWETIMRRGLEKMKQENLGTKASLIDLILAIPEVQWKQAVEQAQKVKKVVPGGKLSQLTLGILKDLIKKE